MNHLMDLRFTDSTVRARKPAIRQVMDTLGLDVLAVSSPEHFPFLSSANLPNLTYVRSRQAYAVFTSKGEEFVIVAAMDATVIQAQSWIGEVVPYIEFVEHPVAVLVREIRRRGVEFGRLGLDLDFVTQRNVSIFEALAPGLVLVDCYDSLAAKRVLKTPEEVATISSAAKVTHQAILSGMGRSQAGETERTVCTRVLADALNHGARTILFSSFGSGANALHTHCFAGDKVIQPDDIVRLDIGPRFGPWLGDLARTYSAGNPSGEQRAFYRALVKLQRETIHFMKPGVKASAVYGHAVRTATQLGITFDYPHIGHSIGYELHESPMLHPGDDTPLEPGMVFNVEPMIINPDHTLFMHTEDLVAIGENEPEVLSLGLADEEIPLMGSVH